MEGVGQFISQHWRQVVETAILWALIYHTYRYFRATRGARIFAALAGIYFGMALVSRWLDLAVIAWILKALGGVLALSLVVIFQPELRRALAELGSRRIFSFLNEKSRVRLADVLVQIVVSLGRRRIGALIAIQRSIDLGQYLETGTRMDSVLTPELVNTVFFSGTTLHDGGMIVRVSDERISGAGCVFPVTQRELADQNIGLRHRAAMGITEESDAIALVVSEETGAISLAINGKLEQNLDEETLRERLNDLLGNQRPEEDGSGKPDEA